MTSLRVSLLRDHSPRYPVPLFLDQFDNFGPFSLFNDLRVVDITVIGKTVYRFYSVIDDASSSGKNQKINRNLVYKEPDCGSNL